ncbi:hypothetical protein CONPUDRAFT_161617 [Coniophora puteana RWD-64-598 SS2]|uniref:PEHE domain-containing protein n=1 Tax=Coniophora puteana (strain RWD-64-598) TaxID=741705 RepID=A0A5M3N6E4_CONPW|nr:uncharacterized protein CONPUDRAFT_161617 [Coniophora puteana RWD-64-598 SS2]EIW86993.1 hypothetical protein CONPUDRAFT_161617 [Coniophora puteana RWD-64-598 SS2]
MAETHASSSNSAPATRPRRVLPSRARRGGPGIGSCDIDVMILDAQKRRFENEPLIPANTSFILTTNSTLAPTASSSRDPDVDASFNTHANQRYFERPDVIKAYRAQQVIQTPEFRVLSEDASVGSRFRPRGSDDDAADLSDAAYERRHRKYEAFEKRIRLREKEKLKHEQYKLRERIDQLRSFDPSAFLNLPASSFSPMPDMTARHPEDEGEPLSQEDVVHVNGTTFPNGEGERRRQEMLEVAMGLEERYRTLLPSERKAAEQLRKAELAAHTPSPFAQFSNHPPGQPAIATLERRSSSGQSQHLFSQTQVVSQHAAQTPAVQPVPTTLILKIKVPQARSSSVSTTGKQARKYSVASPSPSRDSPLGSVPPPQEESSPTPAFTPTVGRPLKRKRGPKPKARPEEPVILIHSPPPIAVEDDKLFLEPAIPEEVEEEVEESVMMEEGDETDQDEEDELMDDSDDEREDGRRRKKEPSLLMQAAIRASAAPQARKTQRNVLAFGTKVPQELEEMRDFELPTWLIDERHLADEEMPP